MRNSLWMRLQLYFRFNGFIIKLCSLYTICDRLSSIIFLEGRTNVYNTKTFSVGEGQCPSRNLTGLRKNDLNKHIPLLHILNYGAGTNVKGGALPLPYG